MIKRIIKRQIVVGGVKIGGNAPIVIQSMLKTKTADISACVRQIRRLDRAGCEIVRAAVKNLDDAQAIKEIKRRIKIPLVCDIHFDYRLALAAINSGADKIRLNPGNIKNRNEIKIVAAAAAKAKIPIRIGVNSGSIFSKKKSQSAQDSLVDSALEYIKLFEGMDFRDIILSLKASDVVTTVDAYRKISSMTRYPLHLGVTAAGPSKSGMIKSAVGIGALLLDGIGDTIRVSLTADPVEEVIAAKNILSCLDLRRFGHEIISCPTCGRCQVDLSRIVKDFKRTIHNTQYAIHKRPLSIAIMGCEVNGPGEAKEADIGIAFGKKTGMIFANGKILKKVSVKNAVKELIKLLAGNF